MTPEIERGHQELAECLRFLEAQMRAKGHEKATARLRIQSSGTVEVWLETHGAEAFPAQFSIRQMDFQICYGDTMAAAFEGAHQAIATMTDSATVALKPWFTEQSTETAGCAPPHQPAPGGGDLSPVAAPASSDMHLGMVDP